MPGEGQERALLIDRCWSIYLLLTERFAVPSNFHEEFPVLVERATISGLLHLTLHISEQHSLYIREEYEMAGHQLRIAGYSYTLIGPSSSPIFRADPLPHHRTDYRKRSLTAFPHHAHDPKGRILSFSGEISDFIDLVQQHLAKPDPKP